MSKALAFFHRLPEPTRAIIETLLAGVVGSAVAVLFNYAILGIYHLVWAPLSEGPIWRFALIGLVVLVGASLSGGLLLAKFSPEASGSGIPQLKVAYWRDMGKVPFRIIWVKFLAGALSVGGGLSLGREGPTVQLAGGLASVIGGKLGLINARRRAITACGAAAGLAAAFNAPIAAVTFVLEEIIEDLNSRSIGRILLASFVSVFVLYLLQGDAPAFRIPSLGPFHAWTYLASLPVGAIAALVGVGFQKSTLGWMVRIKRTSKLPLWLRPVVGALITWAAACVLFGAFGRTGVLGLGYGDLNLCLQGEMALAAVLALLAAKWLATTASYAWGNCGGIFAPTLFLGAMAGRLCGQSLEALLPLQPDDVRVLTIVGMSACLGAVVRAPVTSILIVFEMTHDFALVPPLMMATLVSQAVSRALCPENFYSQVLSDAGLEMDHHVEPSSLADWKRRRVATFATFRPICVTNWKTEAVRDLLEASKFQAYPVVGADSTVQGIVHRGALEEFLRSGQQPETAEPVAVLPDATLGSIERLLVDAPLNIVLLVSPQRTLLGLFSLHDLLRSQISATDGGAG